MKSFEYVSPRSLNEATELLSKRWGETEILAGGTDLVTSMKQGLSSPQRVVSLKNISSLRRIDVNDELVTLGAMVKLSALADHEAIQKDFPSLVAAVHGIGSTQMVHQGTVGGDLCQRPRCWFFRNGLGAPASEATRRLVEDGDNRYHALFGNDGLAMFSCPSSLGPALIALGAELTVVGPNGRREVSAAGFFQTPGSAFDRETVLQPNEVLEAIHIPRRGLRNATYEVRHRHGLDWPYATASVAFKLSGRTVSEGSVVLGHVAPTPWRAVEASNLLNGATLSEALASDCGSAAIKGARPLSRNGYKVQLVQAAVKRAVLAAAQA